MRTFFAFPTENQNLFKRISPHLISLLCRICSKRPRLSKGTFLSLEGIFQTALAGIMGFAPMRFSQSRPHCVILWPDGSIIMVYAGHGGDRVPNGLWKTLLSLGCEIGGRNFWTIFIGWAPRLSCAKSLNVMAKRFPSLFPCGLHRVTYLKYCYLIFKFQERQFCLSYSLPLGKGVWAEFFLFF